MDNILNAMQFESETFYYILLPPIVFEAGYSLKKKNFFYNMGTIMSFAVFGTIISTIVIGYGLFGCAKLGLIKELDTDGPLESLLFGSLISAVDTVATLSIMGSPSSGATPLLFSLVFGESVLNDAVSIVLFRTLNNFGGQSFGTTQLLTSVLQFLFVSLGSIGIGVFIGLLCSLFLRRFKSIGSHPNYEVALIFLFAYSSYALAEIAHMSGVMSLFLTGVVLNHYAWYSLSSDAQTTTLYIFKTMSSLTETFVFVYMGINVFSFSPKVNWDPGFVVIATLLCPVGRAFNIFPLSFLSNLLRREKITWKLQVALWFSGLRGAIAFALALNARTPHAPSLVAATIMIILFTTLVLGPFTSPLMRALKINEENSVPLLSVEDDDEEQQDEEMNEEISELIPPTKQPKKKVSCLHRLWKKLDEKVMKPLFGGKPREIVVLRARSSI